MDNKMMEKTMDTLGNVTKIAANLSEANKEKHIDKQPLNRTSDDSNNASTGSQNIQIHMDTGKKKEPKPIEKHIHEFPETRPLTEQECELALKRAQMEYELKKSEQVHFQNMDKREWEHRLEVEKKNEKKGKIRRVVFGLLGAVGIGSVAYSFWADYRDHKNAAMAPKLPDGTVKAEGSVN